jgi:hypothetical protein
MENKIGKLVLGVFILFSSACMSDSLSSKTIPVSIDEVSTLRIGENLIRVIRYNMELEPKIIIERLTTPVLSVIESKTIDSILLAGETLDFNKSQGVFIEDFSIKNSIVNIKFEYFYPTNGSVIVNCNMLIASNNFEPLQCQK